MRKEISQPLKIPGAIKVVPYSDDSCAHPKVKSIQG